MSWLGVLVLGLAVPWLTGVALFAAWPDCEDRPGLRLLAGCAALLAAAHSLSFVLPLRTAAWLLGGALLLLWVLRWRALAAGWQQLRRAARQPLRWVAALLFLGLFAWQMEPLIREPDLQFYDGSGNNDSFFYIVNARWLQDQSFFEERPVDPLHPLYSRVFTGWRNPLGRTGAEACLAVTSTWLASDPLVLYKAHSALFVCLGFLVVLAAVWPLLRACGPWWGAGLLVLAGSSPLLIHIHNNGNYATLFGVVFGSALTTTCARVLAEPRLQDARHKTALALFACANLAVYPELFIFMAGVVGLSCITLARGSWRGLLGNCALVFRSAARSVLLTPWIWLVSVFIIIWAFQVASSQGTLWDSIFAGLGPGAAVLKFFGLNDASLPRSASIAAALAGAVLLASFGGAFFLRDRGLRGLVRASSLVGLAVLGVFLALRFHYGYFKLAQYFSLLLLVASCGFLAELARGRAALTRLAALLLLLAAGGWNLLNLSRHLEQARAIASIKCAPREFSALRELELAEDATLLVFPVQLEFFGANWAAYFLDQLPVCYPYGPAGRGGGYLAHVASGTGLQQLTHIAEVLLVFPGEAGTTRFWSPGAARVQRPGYWRIEVADAGLVLAEAEIQVDRQGRWLLQDPLPIRVRRRGRTRFELVSAAADAPLAIEAAGTTLARGLGRVELDISSFPEEFSLTLRGPGRPIALTACAPVGP